MTTYTLTPAQQATYDAAVAKYGGGTSTTPTTTTAPVNNISLTPTQQATYDAGMKKYGYADPTKSVGSVATNTSTMTPSTLAPVQSFPTVTAPTSPTYPVSTLATLDMSLQPTAQETQASGLSTQLGGLYNELVGKSAYQTKENSIYGVDAAQKTIQDLSAQLTGIKNEAAAIPLQLQQGAADRGVTTTQLGAQENSRLRTNAIAALGVSTLLSAAQGQLANAQAMADKAVSQKYDPILEQIQATQQNLQLILNDPLTSLADKNRAIAQQQKQDALQQQTTLAKQNYSTVQNIAISAAANMSAFKPTAQYQTASQALQAIQTATDPVMATQIAVSTGLIAPTGGSSSGGASTTKILGSASTGYFSYDTATGVKTPISGAQAKASGGSVASGSTGSALTDAQSAIKAGADPEAVRKAFLADHPTSSASWNSFFGVSTPTTGYPTPAPAPTTKTGLFGWGFLGL